MTIINNELMKMNNIRDVYCVNKYNRNKPILFIEINDTIIDIINSHNNEIYILWKENVINIYKIKKYKESIKNNVKHLCYSILVSKILKSLNIKHEYYRYDGYNLICHKYSNFFIIKKSKIALLLSGYTRTFYLVYKNLIKFINNNKNYVFDIYLLVHSGNSEIGGKYKGKNNNFIKNLKLLNNFNIKMLIFKNNYDDIDSKIMRGFTGQFFFLNQLYEYYLNYINYHNISYDLVMRTRYDIKLTNYIIKKPSYYKSKIIVPKGYFHGFNNKLTNRIIPDYKDKYSKIRNFIDNNYIINDKMAISTPKLMHTYLTHGKRVSQIAKYLKDNYSIASTEGYLAYDLKKHNIYFTFDDRLGCSLVRK